MPDEQVVNPLKRGRALFAGDPLPRYLTATGERILRASFADLAAPSELRELGMALFLDRPLGAFKAPGEPDQTPILSYEAFSRSIAGRRLDSIGKDREFLSAAEQAHLQDALHRLPECGRCSYTGRRSGPPRRRFCDGCPACCRRFSFP